MHDKLIPRGVLSEAHERLERLRYKLDVTYSDTIQTYDVLDHWKGGELNNEHVVMKYLDSLDGDHSAFMVTITKPYTMEWHTHNQDEFIFVVSGHVEIRIGPRIQDLGEGDSVKITKGVPHRWSNILPVTFMLMYKPKLENE